MMNLQGQVLLVGERHPAAEPAAGGGGISGNSFWGVHPSPHCADHHGSLSGAARLHTPLQGGHH